ncbi:chromatin remodelling complex Rsc7/Swp82 subunit-domain-containing protein [Lactarius hengduanensis]|nr:chromatin remodelling complex Rsc7/Swp82 subunit-domain-containing protein [Lactarius hengduanensis]
MGGGKPFSIVQGKVYVIEGDEFVTEDDAKGDTRSTETGTCSAVRRRFKAQTFNLPNRHPERMYMLAIDAARTSGFRDSLYYFRRNPLAHKLNATPSEKEFLIEIGKLGSHLRTRSLHGAKTLIDGRSQTPNAPSAAALAAAELANAQKGDRAGGTQGIYRAGGPTTLFGQRGLGPYSDGPLNAVRKSLLNRDGLNEENWMLTEAQRTADASAEWAKQRRALVREAFGATAAATSSSSNEEKKEDGEEDRVRGKDQGAQEQRGDESAATGCTEAQACPGVYEPHIGIVLSERARWEGLKDSAEKRQVSGGTKAGNGAEESEGGHEAGRIAAEERRRLLELTAADLNS